MTSFIKDGQINGTGLQGYINAYYSQLVDVFGEPNFGPNDNSMDKVTCQWILTFENGTVATIYDWKEMDTPFSEYRWHIGGRSLDAISKVLEVFHGR